MQAPASAFSGGGIALFTGSPKIEETLGAALLRAGLGSYSGPAQLPSATSPVASPCGSWATLCACHCGGARTRGCGTVEGDPVDRSDRTDSQRERDVRPARKGVWGPERWGGREIIPGFRAD